MATSQKKHEIYKRILFLKYVLKSRIENDDEEQVQPI
jgi:hypothetical protein